MADVTFTAGSVLPGTNAVVVEGVAGATITQGLAVYFDGSEYLVADCTDAAKDAPVGFALTSSIDNGPIKVQQSGAMTCDNLTAGGVYVLSAAGKICPAADLNLTTDYATIMGVAASATSLIIGITVSGYKTP